MSIKRALISVYDKTNVIEFAGELAKLGIEIISTGGTAKAIATAGIPHKQVDEITGFPEIMDGRVKTLHPNIHGGILARRNVEADVNKLAELGIGMIDIVAVNLYPFARTAADPNAALDDVIEMIDIGGPGMLRAAAKNFKWVLPVCTPSSYNDVIKAIKENAIDETFRRKLAAEAFHHTSQYDQAVAAYLTGSESQDFPEDLILHFHRHQTLRYGENPHQKAAFYMPSRKRPGFEQLCGKELSFNNYLDMEAAAGLAAEFDQPVVALLKHTVPCGVGMGDNLVEAYQKAFATDPISPFGGIVGVNRPVTGELAEAMKNVFWEVIVATDFTEEALQVFRTKKNLRLIRMPDLKTGIDDMRTAMGGLLVQATDSIAPLSENWKVVSKRQPTESEWTGLEFAWKVTRWAKSNAIVFTNVDKTVGIGLGQTSRVDSAELAVARSKKYGTSLQNSVAGSDAFFPFADGAEAVISAGATAIIEPGGSVRDAEVIEACDKRNVALVFTGERHFRH